LHASSHSRVRYDVIFTMPSHKIEDVSSKHVSNTLATRFKLKPSHKTEDVSSIVWLGIVDMMFEKGMP